MKVLVADQFSPAGMEEMKEAGIDVVYNSDWAGEALKDAIAAHQPQVLVVRSKKVEAMHIDASKELKVIVRAGAGYDTIDFVHAASRGIYVCNCPGKNASAVAELTMGLILSIDRRTAEGNALFKEGKWNKGMFVDCKGIRGRTLGIIGYGNIGQCVCEAAKAFGMSVLVSTRTQHSGLDKLHGFQYVSQEELLARSDIVSLHIPNTPQTKGMVNEAFLAQMKENAVLINTSRGDCVDEDALLNKLEKCKGFWCGLDVFKGEPSAKACEWKHPLAMHPRVYGTHHCGASTNQAETAIGIEAVRIIKQFATSGKIDKENWVNAAVMGEKKTLKISIRHLDNVGVLAFCFKVFADQDWNVQEFENIVFKGRKACLANLHVEGDASHMAKV